MIVVLLKNKSIRSIWSPYIGNLEYQFKINNPTKKEVVGVLNKLMSSKKHIGKYSKKRGSC